MGRRHKTVIIFIFAGTFVLASASGLNALPLKMLQVNGRVQFNAPDAETLQINQQTRQLNLETSDFSVENGEIVEIIHVIPESITNIRVTGDRKTAIAGQIKSKGRVNINNSKGFVFYPGANFKVKKLVFDVR